MAEFRVYIFFETWDNEQSVHEYKDKVVSVLGNPRPGEEFPEVMNSLIAEDKELA